MNIIYSTESPDGDKLYGLYDSLGWNGFLKLNANQLLTAMKQSWYVVYAYEDNRLIGTGRVVSDGVINAYLCGLGVHRNYRSRGIGTEISRRLVPFYESMGFEAFAVGMKLSR